ncbi:Nop16 domain containing protein [Asbolus verrucosus]|uniref:Nucleolar protein 16 n=1 Tax=Asbolus verrucosus TaxID=1661398 RepID=A0A482VIH4_ASBVE|nr:Nop16 domain containing protein [Asbolus verrucosus]
MTKLRKQRRRKVYRHNVSRKRLRNKIESVGKISCKEIAEAWDKRKSVQTNMEEMGLSYDPNKTIKIPSNKQKLKVSITSNTNDWNEERIEAKPTKCYVAEALETDAKAPRVKMFRLPKSQVQWVTYLMDKYGQDYKAMARDTKNYNQETWKQIRAKIKKFKNIPEQYSGYLKERNLTESNMSDAELSDGEL